MARLKDVDVYAHVAMLETVLDNVGAYIFTKDINGIYTYANQAVLDLFDKPIEQVIGYDDSHFFDLNISNQIKGNDQLVMQAQKSITEEESNFVKSTGELRIYRSTKSPLFNERGEVVGMCGISTDITKEKQLQATINEQKKMLDVVMDNIDAYVYMKSSERRFLFVNKKVAGLFGDKPENIIGKLDTEVLPKEVADHFWQSDHKVFETNEKQYISETYQDDNGEESHYLSTKIPYHGNDQVPALIGFSSDVTELFKLKEEFKRQARTDALTGLYNRRFFIDEARKEFQRTKRYNRALSLMSIDVDYFKDINDKYGHPVGDAVLVCIADNLKKLVRIEDTLARVGGEEFSILLPETTIEKATQLANRIRAFHSSCPCTDNKGNSLQVTVSIGITAIKSSDKDFDDIFSRADKALYQAKESGRDRVCQMS